MNYKIVGTVYELDKKTLFGYLVINVNAGNCSKAVFSLEFLERSKNDKEIGFVNAKYDAKEKRLKGVGCRLNTLTKYVIQDKFTNKQSIVPMIKSKKDKISMIMEQLEKNRSGNFVKANKEKISNCINHLLKNNSKEGIKLMDVESTGRILSGFLGGKENDTVYDVAEDILKILKSA